MGKIEKRYDLVIVGGGLSGVCAALAAARHGANTALIHDRPVLGGNASSEFRMHICGADRHAQHPGLRETGILEEILLEVKRVNENPDFWALDTVLWEKCTYQTNLDLYLNTYVHDVLAQKGRIESVQAVQLTSERRYTFTAPLFMDATGDGAIADKAGAEWRIGREGKAEYGEQWAPDAPDTCTMGSSLLFVAKDMGRPVPFEKPKWAYSFTEKELAGRGHGEITSGYWWIELGGDALSTIDDAEEIRDELMKSLYGIWDHIKNGGDHGAENYALAWIANLPGKRESRRVIGDYVLTEQDLLSERVFDDAVAYGGWSMDCHTPGGLRSPREAPTQFLGDFGAYTIPYRCLYSKNVENLFIVGRIISASHMAFSSLRVMGTCAVIGQAGGTAAAIAVEKGLTPRGVNDDLRALQNALMRDDCYLPGIRCEDESDAVKRARITATAETDTGRAENVQNGWQRGLGGAENAWIAPLSDGGVSLRATFEAPKRIGEVILRFDSDLAREITPSISAHVLDRQNTGVPKTLVKNYTIEGKRNGKRVFEKSITGNAQRLNRHDAGGALIDELVLTVTETNGDACARVFELNAYTKA